MNKKQMERKLINLSYAILKTLVNVVDVTLKILHSLLYQKLNQ